MLKSSLLFKKNASFTGNFPGGKNIFCIIFQKNAQDIVFFLTNFRDKSSNYFWVPNR